MCSSRGRAMVAVLLLIATTVAVGQQSKAKQQKNPVVKCWQCNSATEGEENCDDNEEVKNTTGSKTHQWQKPCEPISNKQYNQKRAIGCRKIVQEVEDKNRIVRECAYTGTDVYAQKRTGNKGVRIFYYQCSDSEYCNGVSQTLGSLAALLSALVLTTLLL